MFNFFKKKKETQEGGGQAAPLNENVAGKNSPRDISDVEIYVMPEKFNVPKQSKGDRKRLFMVVGISSAVLIVIVILFFVFKDKIFNLGNITPLAELPPLTNDDHNAQDNTIATSTTTQPVRQPDAPNATSSPETATTTPETATTTPGMATTTPEIATTTPSIATSTSEIATSTNPLATTTPETATTTPILDSDKDGLSDLEEEIFSSDKFNPDTDGDGYLDGVEVVNLYDPTIYSPGKLINGVAVKNYEENRYGLIYPKSWQTEVAEEGKILFKAQNGEFIELIISPNLEGIATLDWYNSQVGNSDKVQDPKEISTKSKLRGLAINDNTIYLNDYNYIYILNYNSTAANVANYSKIFEMMWRSFTSKIDTDGDGKLDYLEIDTYHSDPKKVDGK